MLKKAEKSIDLSALEIQNYTQEQVASFRIVREDYPEQLEPVLKGLVNDPTLVEVKGVNYGELQDRLKKAMELKEAEDWLEKKWKLIQENRRAVLSGIKEQMDRVVEVAKVQSQADPQVTTLFADFLDYRATPGKKAAATKKKKAQSQG